MLSFAVVQEAFTLRLRNAHVLCLLPTCTACTPSLALLAFPPHLLCSCGVQLSHGSPLLGHAAASGLATACAVGQRAVLQRRRCDTQAAVLLLKPAHATSASRYAPSLQPPLPLQPVHYLYSSVYDLIAETGHVRLFHLLLSPCLLHVKPSDCAAAPHVGKVSVPACAPIVLLYMPRMEESNK